MKTVLLTLSLCFVSIASAQQVNITASSPLLDMGCQVCEDVDPVPLVVYITGQDEHDNVLYTRKAYLFYGPIDSGYCPQPNRLAAIDVVTVWRWFRPDGERCNDAAPKVIETGYTSLDFCTPKPASVKKP